jgi:hypothetical protein
MKNREFKKLAIMGLASGLLVSSQISAQDTSPKNSNKSVQGNTQSNTDKDADDNDGNMDYHLMTEDELLLELDSEGTKMYKSLTPEGKALALKVASARCDHTNECAGLNACQTPEHACAGKGTCKHTGKCAIADKNLAVKLVRDKMAKKRQQATTR